MRAIGLTSRHSCTAAGRTRASLRSRAVALVLSLVILAGSLAVAACSSESAPKGAVYPLTVTDLMGRPVELTGVPQRIVTTHPTATEMVCSAGGLPVGCDSSSKYPAEVIGLPAVGSAFYLNVESIAGLQPDLVVIEAMTQARYLDSLSALGVPVMAVRAASLDDVVDSLTLVGKVIDRSDDAAAAVKDIEDRIEAAQASQSASSQSRSVLVLIADEQSKIYAARADSYPGTVAGLLGLNNLAADMAGSGPFAGFAELTGEALVGLDPDVIFTITPAPQPAPRLSALLPSLPVYRDKAAVKEGRLVELDPSLYLQAPGPRIAMAVEGMLQITKGCE